MDVTRSELVTVAVQGDYGKPRPAVVIQANAFFGLRSIMVLPLTSDIRMEANLFRVIVYPDQENGLRIVSQVMVDKAMPVSVDKIGRKIGILSRKVMKEIDRCIVIFFGIE